MNYYKLKYKDETFKIVKGNNSLEVIRKYDLCSKEHIGTRVIQLEGEQLVIAIANDQ